MKFSSFNVFRSKDSSTADVKRKMKFRRPFRRVADNRLKLLAPELIQKDNVEEPSSKFPNSPARTLSVGGSTDSPAALKDAPEAFVGERTRCSDRKRMEALAFEAQLIEIKREKNVETPLHGTRTLRLRSLELELKLLEIKREQQSRNQSKIKESPKQSTKLCETAF